MPAENHTTLTPDTPVRYLKGVGPKTAQRFWGKAMKMQSKALRWRIWILMHCCPRE